MYSNEQKQITSNFDEESEIRFIVENNIYGVDLNSESVEITQLSIFLKIASNNRKLIGLSDRIKAGNSVIDDKEIDSMAFEWHANFTEVLHPDLDNGFDVIIGNPPYVRQEILDHKEKMTLPDNHTLILPEKYTIDPKSDLSCYFHYHALNLLKKDGILGFISSDSWLHFGYGFGIQKLFLDNSDILEITKINFNVFEDADISAAIILLRKSQTKHHKALFKTVNKGGFESQNFNINKKPQKEFIPDNWNNHFSEFDFMPKIEMVKMQDLGFIKRGKTTGYNDFFVLTKDIIEKYGITKEYRKPVLSGNIHEGLLIDTDASEYLLNANDSKGKLVKSENGKNVLKYIEYGEKTKIIPKRGKNNTPCLISELSTVKNRKMWYSLDLTDKPAIFLARFAHHQMKFYENNNSFCARDNFAYLTPNKIDHVHAFLSYLSSSYFALLLEINGHIAGGGALQFLINDYKTALVPNFDKLSDRDLSKMSKAWLDYRDDFDKAKLDNTVFQILGFNEDEKKTILDKLESKINTRINRNK